MRKRKKDRFAGDLNADPKTAKRVGDKHLFALCTEGWHIPDAAGEWSYASGTRVDHAVFAPGFDVSRAEYLSKVEDILLAGRKLPGAISDHAALLVELSARSAA